MSFCPAGFRIAGNYEVASRPLTGGMGIVYLCFDHAEQRPVALKTFKPEYLPDRAARDRFLREGDTWIKLGRHPHIVRAYSIQRIGDGTEVYLVLELIVKEQGRADASLRSWLTSGKALPIEQALLFAMQVVRGMEHATKTIPGLVHRDLKPDNLLIGSDKLAKGSSRRLRVTDFGLASVLGELRGAGTSMDQDAAQIGRTHLTHGIVGTPPYMAPEQWRGEQLGGQTDIYALGCIVFEMLAGVRIVEGNTLKSLEAAHCGGKHKLLPNAVPASIRTWVARCVAVESGARYACWSDVEAGLDEAYRDVTGGALPAAEPQEAAGRAERVGAGWSSGAIGASYRDIGKAEVGLQYFERAARTGVKEGERELEAAGLLNLGIAYRDLGDARRAISYSEQSLGIHRETGDFRGEGASLVSLGNAYAMLGDARRAVGYFEQSLAINREIGDVSREGAALAGLGDAYVALGDSRRAIGFCEQALAIYREIGDRRGEASVLGNLGTIYRSSRDLLHGLAYSKQALAAFREIGARREEAVELSLQGGTYALMKDGQNAMACWQEGLQIAEEVESKLIAGNCAYKLAMSLADTGNLDPALQLAQKALKYYSAERPDWARDAQELVNQIQARTRSCSRSNPKTMG